jgi:glycosyltransferase involved in cell wall biosynthesis
MLSAPEMSVILPVFNAELWLRESIESIIRQEFCSFELIIMNDGSTDGSLEIIRHFADRDKRIVTVDRENRGLIHTLNEGVSRALSPLIVRQDADDVASIDRLATLFRIMKEKPRIDLCGSWCDVIDAAGCRINKFHYPTEHEEICWAMVGYSAIAHPTVVFRRSAFQRFGPYDPAFVHAEDYEMWTRWIRLGARVANVPRPLVKYRVSDNQVSRRFAKEQAESAIRAAAIYVKSLLGKDLSPKQLSGLRQLVSPWLNNSDAISGIGPLLRLSRLPRFAIFLRRTGTRAQLAAKCVDAIRIFGASASSHEGLSASIAAVALWGPSVFRVSWWIGLVKLLLFRPSGDLPARSSTP